MRVVLPLRHQENSQSLEQQQQQTSARARSSSGVTGRPDSSCASSSPTGGGSVPNSEGEAKCSASGYRKAAGKASSTPSSASETPSKAGLKSEGGVKERKNFEGQVGKKFVGPGVFKYKSYPDCGTASSHSVASGVKEKPRKRKHEKHYSSEENKAFHYKKAAASKMVRIPPQNHRHWDRPENRDDPAELENDPQTSVVISNEDPVIEPYNDPVWSRFEECLKKRGLEIVEQDGDGNCLFRAVSLQVYGDANMHGEVRRRCLDFMAKDEAHFSQFVTGEPFRDYVMRKRHDGVHGDNAEIQAISELFNRPVEVFVPENGAKPLNIFHAEYKTADAPIRLSYHDGNHYNAVIDPFRPTAGLGLGLPGLEPGLADKLQLEKAVKESDQHQIDQAIKESNKFHITRAIIESEQLSVREMYEQKAIHLSDIEATDFELEQAVLASSLESYQAMERNKKKPSNVSSSLTRNNLSSTSRIHSQDETSTASSLSAAAPSHSASYFQPNPMMAHASSSTSSAVAQPRVETNDISPHLLPIDEYPEACQELVMNGFELSRVLHAYELIGDNIDDLLAFLLNSSGS